MQTFVKKKTVALSSFLKLESENEKTDETQEKKDLVFIKRHADSVIDHDINMFGT